MNRDRTLYLMQGVSGSGKSTVAKMIQDALMIGVDLGEVGTRAVPIFASDDFWYDDAGVYNFDVSRLGEAHAENQRWVRIYMIVGEVPIIVDNTNTRQWEAQPYFDLAHQYGYTIQVIRCDPGLDVALARNATRSEDRRIPDAVIHAQYARMEVLHPEYKTEGIS